MAENKTIDDTSNISPIERRNSLEKHLQHRPDPQDLVDRNILKDPKIAPGLQQVQQELEKNQATDNLRKGLEKRLAREDLVERECLSVS